MWAQKLLKRFSASKVEDAAAADAMKAAKKKDVQLKYKRREHLFGAIIFTNTIAEITAIIFSPVTILYLDMRGSDGEKRDMGQMVANTLLVLFFEVVLSEYFIGFLASKRTQEVMVIKNDKDGKEDSVEGEGGEGGIGGGAQDKPKKESNNVAGMKSLLSSIKVRHAESKFVHGSKEEFVVDLGRVWRDTSSSSLLWWFMAFVILTSRNSWNLLMGSGCSVREATETGDGTGGFAIVEGSDPWLEFCYEE